MKKNLTRWLTKKAKDGDMETVAEFIEEVIGEAVEAPENPEPEQAEEPVVVEVPENHEITIDEESAAGILERLDRLIALLTEFLHPAPAADEETSEAEEISEAVEEIIEAVQSGNTPVSEIEEIVEAIAEESPDNPFIAMEDPCEGDPEKQEVLTSRDALVAAISAVRPALMAMTPSQRRKVGRDIFTRLYPPRKGADTGLYAALKSARKPEKDLRDLGKQIMARRNPHYKQ